MSFQRDVIHDPRSSYREQCQVDTTQMCRICAEFSDGLVPVFSKNGAKMDLINKIHTHLPIEVTLYDVLPLSCCNHCIEKLNGCHELVNRCLEADWKLRSLLQGDKHLTEYSKGNKKGIEELDKEASLSSSIVARNAIARTDQHLILPSKTYAKSILKGLKRKASTLGKVDTLQEDEHPNISEVEDIHISYSAHLPEVEKEDWPKTCTVKRKCSQSTLPDKEKTLQGFPVEQKQKETQKYKVVLVKLKNSASLSKAVQVEKALKIVKTKQEAGNLPEAKGPVPKRLQKKLQGLKSYGLLKPNKYIRLPLEPRDYQTEDISKTPTGPRSTDHFICPAACEKMFKSMDALNTHVASSHKDLLFCYCSQTFTTQTQLNEHLELHMLEEIESVPLNSRVTEDIKRVPLKSRVTEEIESVPSKSRIESVPSKPRVTKEIEKVPSKSRVTEDIESVPSKSRVMEEIESVPSKSCLMKQIESVPLKSRVTEEIESVPSKSHLKEETRSVPSKSCSTEEIESVPLKSRVKEEIESELIKSCVKGEIKSEPSKSSPTEICEPLITQIVLNLPVPIQRQGIKKLGDTWSGSLTRENVANDHPKSVETLVDIRSNPLTKERIFHGDQYKNVTRPVGDSLRSLNSGQSGNDPGINFENGTLAERKFIDLTEGKKIKCESPVAFSSLDESRVLMDSIIASVPKIKTKIWRCPMCGLVYPGEDRWLKHCEGIDFRCHFCKVVLGSVLEQKQHETEHLRVTICSKPSCFT